MDTGNAPFIKIILPAGAGIAFSYVLKIPVWLGVSCLAACVFCAIATRRLRVGHIYVWLSVMFFFFAMAGMRASKSSLPPQQKIIAVSQIVETPYVKGRWRMTTADVGYFRPLSDSACMWSRADERLFLAVDTSYKDIEVGLQLAFTGWFNPLETTGNGYADLMKLRGVHGIMYLRPENILSRAPYVSRTPGYYASVLQAAALKRLERLDMTPDSKAVVTAMTAGDKRGVERMLRQDYSRTGAAHLLAVSGLHVGIVFILINLLLYLLPLLKRGHVVKNIAAVLAIWLYAMVAGLSPSVIRAALMFSFAQIALASNSYRNALNIMLGSAVVMLAVNPNYAADPSFLLSYSAVLSILLFFNPVYSLVRTRWKLVNSLLSIIIVGLVATLGTAPLVAYWFGNFPVSGMIINPFVIFTAHIIVMFGVLWILMPFGFWEPVFSWILSAAAGAQNVAVRWSASLEWASFDISLPLWSVLAIYAAYVALAVWLHARKREKSLSLSL